MTTVHTHLHYYHTAMPVTNMCIHCNASICGICRKHHGLKKCTFYTWQKPNYKKQ